MPIVKDSKYLYPTQEREPESIFLHSFGLKIDNRLVMENVFSKSKEVIYDNSGSVRKTR